MTTAYIALGSNLGDSRALLASALAAIDALPGTGLVAHSQLYRSAAIGPGNQADYLNMVAEIHTELSPDALLEQLQGIEQCHGRERGERWSARTLDLDILLYGRDIISTPQLTVPHTRMTERNFVLYPLSELAPELVLPCGTPLRNILDQCPRTALEALGEHIEPGR
jgi:2-amino-4-hydroxy-6-hydroxymethyldihydropteridine diphosphokinase